MPVITAITLQKRDPSRCNISIDGRFAYTLTALEVSQLDLRPGQALSPEQAEDLAQQASQSKAYQAAIRLIAVRRRSAQEIKLALMRKGYASEEIVQVIERLTASGLLDDLEFARAWVADRSLLKPRSRRQLEQELAQKGVSRAIVEIAVAEVGDQEDQQALRIAEKKYRTGRYDAQKLTAYLMRQGFSYDVSKAAVGQLELDA